MSEVTDRAIEQILEVFGGDTEAAIQALRNQANSDESLKTLVVQPVEPSRHFDGPPIISLQAVRKSYKLGKQTINALQGIDLAIYKGEIVAIIGPSGSGKSTLLQIIGCLDVATSGTVRVDGQETAKLRDARLSELRRSTIGFIFQSFYLQPFLRLGDNVAVPAMFTNLKRRDIEAKTAALLETVGLSDRKNHFPKELSGGQIQRAAIARALINQPKIILADEPTGNLDSANSASIIELFKTIRDQMGTTIVVVTHNPDIAAQADRVIRLKDGALQ